jgi:hypothetical protein
MIALVVSTAPSLFGKQTLEQNSIQVSRMLGGYVVTESPLETSDETAQSIEIELFNCSGNTNKYRS